MTQPLAINSLTDFKRVLSTPGVSIRGTYHHRHSEPHLPERVSHFLERFKQPRKVAYVKRSYFDIDQGGRLELTAKAGWRFNGTSEVSLLANDNSTVLLTYVVETPTPPV